METIGIIMAGGRSRRMGTDKALLKHDGVTFLQHAKNLLSAVGINTHIILGRPEEENGIPDPQPGAGPTANLCAFIEQQTLPIRLVVLPVDMPLMGALQLNALLDQGTAAFFENLYLPFVAPISESLNTPIFRMKHFLEVYEAQAIPIPEKWTKNLVNINENGDLAQLKG